MFFDCLNRKYLAIQKKRGEKETEREGKRRARELERERGDEEKENLKRVPHKQKHFFAQNRQIKSSAKSIRFC